MTIVEQLKKLDTLDGEFKNLLLQLEACNTSKDKVLIEARVAELQKIRSQEKCALILLYQQSLRIQINALDALRHYLPDDIINKIEADIIFWQEEIKSLANKAVPQLVVV